MAPDLSGPGVHCLGSREDDDGLVVNAPGGQWLAVEGAFGLGGEAFGVLPHAVEALALVAGRGDDAEGTVALSDRRMPAPQILRLIARVPR